MATKKITLNELRSIVKQIIKEESGHASFGSLGFLPNDKDYKPNYISVSSLEIGDKIKHDEYAVVVYQVIKKNEDGSAELKCIKDDEMRFSGGNSKSQLGHIYTKKANEEISADNVIKKRE